MKNAFYFLVYATMVGCSFISCKEEAQKISGSSDINVIQEEPNQNLPPIQEAHSTDTVDKDEVISHNESNSDINKKDLLEESAITSTPEPKKDKPVLKGKIAFDEVVYNFGRVPQGKVVNKKFKFTNTGQAPLNIKSATASCGCTAPSFPFMPIEPGGEGFIEVNFNSVDKMGMQKQNVHVHTDGNPSRVTLKMNGVVVPKEG